MDKVLQPPTQPRVIRMAAICTALSSLRYLVCSSGSLSGKEMEEKRPAVWMEENLSPRAPHLMLCESENAEEEARPDKAGKNNRAAVDGETEEQQVVVIHVQAPFASLYVEYFTINVDRISTCESSPRTVAILQPSTSAEVLFTLQGFFRCLEGLNRIEGADVIAGGSYNLWSRNCAKELQLHQCERREIPRNQCQCFSSPTYK